MLNVKIGKTIMSTCCCSMAGTKACDTCTNGPSNQAGSIGNGFVFPSYYEPMETTEEMIRRIIKEESEE